MRPSLHVCEKSASSGTYAQLNRQWYKTFCHKLSKFSAAKNPFHKIINTKDNLIQYVFSDYLWDLIFKNFKHFDRYGKILNKHSPPPPKKKKPRTTPNLKKEDYCKSEYKAISSINPALHMKIVFVSKNNNALSRSFDHCTKLLVVFFTPIIHPWMPCVLPCCLLLSDFFMS